MTELLFRDDAYRTNAVATVVAHMPDGGIVPDRSIYYPTGGGQPGDGGRTQIGPAARWIWHNHSREG